MEVAGDVRQRGVDHRDVEHQHRRGRADHGQRPALGRAHAGHRARWISSALSKPGAGGPVTTKPRRLRVAAGAADDRHAVRRGEPQRPGRDDRAAAELEGHEALLLGLQQHRRLAHRRAVGVERAERTAAGVREPLRRADAVALGDLLGRVERARLLVLDVDGARRGLDGDTRSRSSPWPIAGAATTARATTVATATGRARRAAAVRCIGGDLPGEDDYVPQL